jgi:nicotinate-nucleotide pyrophosphorylase (carboxylating)
VEVEVESLAQVDEAIAAGAEVLLLDNMTPEQVREAAARIAGRAVIEVSGGVSLQTVRGFAEAGAQIISAGALTHSAPAADISLELKLAG